MKKKILFIQQNLQGGGAEKVLVDLLNNFNYSQYEIDLIVIFKYGVYQDQINKNVHVTYLMEDGFPRLLATFKSRGYHYLPRLYMKYKLHKTINNKRFDTIISFMEGITTVAHNMVRNWGNNNISWIHTDIIKNNWCLKSFYSIEEQKRIYQKMDDLVFVSNDAQKAFEKQFGISKGHIIYNIIDANSILRKAASSIEISKPEYPTIVTIGRLVPVKNQKLLIEAAHMLSERGVRAYYWILGEGIEREDLENLIKKYDLQEEVRLLGFHSNPYPYLNAADIFVLSSLTEGYPLVVCEALTLGKPILSTKTTGPSELLCNGVGVLSGFDVEEFAGALEELIVDEAKRKNLSKRAIEKSKMFSVGETMNNIYSIL